MKWQSELTAEEVISKREDMISQLEKANLAMRMSGVCDAWFAGCDEVTVGVAGAVNGDLFHQLVVASGHRDPNCAELF